jgi:Leucine-rich repeat (LRR) protein
MTKLSYISMYKNGLSEIPRSLGKATSLQMVLLADNKIEVIVKELEGLTNMYNN